MMLPESIIRTGWVCLQQAQTNHHPALNERVTYFTTLSRAKILPPGAEAGSV